MKPGLHLAALKHAVGRLAAKPLSTLLSALVIAIALSLPALGLVLLDNLASLARGVSGKPEISVFLRQEAAADAIRTLEKKLAGDGRIAALRFVPRDQALKELASRGGFADIASELPENPLPDAFILEPKGDDPAAIKLLAESLRALPEVAHVQLDSDWVERMQTLIDLARQAVLLLAALLGTALVIITFNTIRLQILTLRHEIGVSLLLGATRSYVRRPFLYFGALQGLLGGALCWLAVLGLVRLIGPTLQRLAASYSVVLDFSGPALPLSLGLLAFAALLGWLGAALSVRRHLHDAAVD